MRQLESYHIVKQLFHLFAPSDLSPTLHWICGNIKYVVHKHTFFVPRIFGFHFSQILNIRYKRFDISELKTRCDASELSREKNIKIVPQVFILVPDNGLCHSTITDCDPKITEIGHLDPVLRNRAGVINRPYKNTIYRVEGPGGKVCGSSF